ncbi:hypothetical protein ACGFZZ_08405 [Streptomyces tendae]|uniref:hypothetical protein n=1 Tax=Streptomyces tendae TaxID=1932 RepID=UPI0033CFA4FF
MRRVPHLTDIRSAGTPAIGDGGPHAHVLGMYKDAVVRGPRPAGEFVTAQVSAGADCTKIVAEAPGEGGPDREALDAPGADIVTHVPLDRPLHAAEAARTAAQGQV